MWTVMVINCDKIAMKKIKYIYYCSQVALPLLINQCIGVGAYVKVTLNSSCGLNSMQWC